MKKLFLCLSILIIGCDPASDNSDIKYFKDKRTGICFAYSCWRCNQAKMATVDCDKVNEYLDK